MEDLGYYNGIYGRMDEMTVPMNDRVHFFGDGLYVYWQATRGTAPRNHAFPEGKSNLWITITPMTFRDLEQRIALTSMEDTRYLHCNIKTLNLIPNVMAAQKAAEENCFEAVFHRGEIVTECAHSNVVILREGRLFSHPNDCYILEGVAKRHLLMAGKNIGIPVTEERLEERRRKW